MKKNSQIHLFIETNLFENLQKEAQEKDISLSELCRQKLRGNNQLDRIEQGIEKLTKLLVHTSS